MTDREIAERIAHDVAVESGMAHESLSALTAVIQEGIDRALAATGRVIRSVEDARLNLEEVASGAASGKPIDPETLAAAEAAVKRMALSAGEPDGMKTTAAEDAWNAGFTAGYNEAFEKYGAREAKARTAPDPQSEIGLRAYLADLAARGLKS